MEGFSHNAPGEARALPAPSPRLPFPIGPAPWRDVRAGGARRVRAPLGLGFRALPSLPRGLVRGGLPSALPEPPPAPRPPAAILRQAPSPRPPPGDPPKRAGDPPPAAASLPPGASPSHPRGPSAARSLRPGTRPVAIAASLARRRDSSAGPRRRRDYFRGRGGGAGRAALLRLLSPRGLVAHSSGEASSRPFPRRNLAGRGGLLFVRGRLRGRQLHLIQGFSYHLIQETLMDPHFIIYQIGFIDGTKLQENLLKCIKVDHQPPGGAKKRQGHTYTCGGIAQSSGN
ncbi:translation initiation factor IF-2-like [Podarcis raffonei]|uniref:translation initiation factor IF-2-like n=1 Tax=Podarcis raffonei TaxID=65483 RepID=UPI0023297A55|nr:translation initiation factor IF-2-like [Podarcis raffonei]